MNNLNLEIRNRDGQKIKSLIHNTNLFIKPHFFIDRLSKSERAPEIEESFDLEILKRVGVILWGIEINKRDAWSPRQRYTYYLRQKELPEADYSIEINKLPANHYFQIDIANNKIRLCGNCISKNKTTTEWIYF